MKIRLVKNGIFPIISDLSGNPIEPDTAYPIAGTLQGEGKLIGIPSLFVRLSGCNLRCTWNAPDGSTSICDTPYSSHHAEEWEEWEVAHIVKVLNQNRGNITHVVLTGGEPMLQAAPLAELAFLLKKDKFHITLETNATLFDSSVMRSVDLVSMSPKLSSSIPFGGKIAQLQNPPDPESIERHVRQYREIRAVQKFIDACYQTSFYSDQPDAAPRRKADKNFQLKFVVSSEKDIEEIQADYLKHLSGVNPDDVVLMPLGETEQLLAQSSPIAAVAAIKHGWRFTPRLQISLFGNKAGT